MFVDASALAVMLLDETAARLLAGRLQAAPTRVTALPSILDALDAVAARTGLDPARAFPILERFLDAAAIKVVSLPAGLAAPTAEAMARFGRTPAQPEGLTANQCLAYAAARYYRLPLLFDDPAFARTDVSPG